MSLLLEAYVKLPQPRLGDDEDLWQAGVQEAVREFRELVFERYTEGTLARIVASSEDPVARRAAAFALGMSGSLNVNPILAGALRDPDEQVRRFAADALWEIWFRGDDAEQEQDLRRALAFPDLGQQLAALDELIRKSEGFAEAYNQRAIVHFRRSEFPESIADCEMVLRLNPYHFGAAAGMGRCYLQMNRQHAALRAFARAIDINPGLTHLQETIRELKNTLGEI